MPRDPDPARPAPPRPSSRLSRPRGSARRRSGSAAARVRSTICEPSEISASAAGASVSCSATVRPAASSAPSTEPDKVLTSCADAVDGDGDGLVQGGDGAAGDGEQRRPGRPRRSTPACASRCASGGARSAGRHRTSPRHRGLARRPGGDRRGPGGCIRGRDPAASRSGMASWVKRAPPVPAPSRPRTTSGSVSSPAPLLLLTDRCSRPRHIRTSSCPGRRWDAAGIAQPDSVVRAQKNRACP